MHPARAEDGPSRHSRDRRVGLFIDFDDLQLGLAEASPKVDPIAVPARLHSLCHEHGRLLVGSAYADWSTAPEVAQEFRRHLIEPRMAAHNDTSREVPADLLLSLDTVESLYVEPQLDTYVLITNRRPVGEVIRRLHRADRAVVLIAASAESTPPLRGRDVFIPLAAALGQGRAPGARTPAEEVDWTPFVQLLDELERNMPFVGFGWLLKKKLSFENCGCATLQDKQELMDQAVEDGILTLYKVDNIEEGADPVTACRVNRESQTVRELLPPDTP